MVYPSTWYYLYLLNLGGESTSQISGSFSRGTCHDSKFRVSRLWIHRCHRQVPWIWAGCKRLCWEISFQTQPLFCVLGNCRALRDSRCLGFGDSKSCARQIRQPGSMEPNWVMIHHSHQLSLQMSYFMGKNMKRCLSFEARDVQSKSVRTLFYPGSMCTLRTSSDN